MIVLADKKGYNIKYPLSVVVVHSPCGNVEISPKRG